MSTIAHSASCHAGVIAGSSPGAPYPDPDHPRDEHTSHAWVPGPRWRACSRCGARDYWVAGAVRCSGSEPEGEIDLEVAIVTLGADLVAFRMWWIGRADLGLSRPSLAEWRAEFLEWSRANGASVKP
jgi:hypothetical protein